MRFSIKLSRSSDSINSIAYLYARPVARCEACDHTSLAVDRKSSSFKARRFRVSLMSVVSLTCISLYTTYSVATLGLSPRIVRIIQAA
jgi:hypothetical protein